MNLPGGVFPRDISQRHHHAACPRTILHQHNFGVAPPDGIVFGFSFHTALRRAGDDVARIWAGWHFRIRAGRRDTAFQRDKSVLVIAVSSEAAIYFTYRCHQRYAETHRVNAGPSSIAPSGRAG